MPSVVECSVHRRLFTLSKILHILLVYVSLRSRQILTLTHKLLGYVKWHIQINHKVWLWYSHVLVFTLGQPAEKRITVILGHLGRLMYRICGRVAVGYDNPAFFVCLAPVLYERAVSVYRIKLGRLIRAYCLRVVTKRPFQIHLYQLG